MNQRLGVVIVLVFVLVVAKIDVPTVRVAQADTALTWTPLLSEDAARIVGRVYDVSELHGDVDTLYIASIQGLFRSSDGGCTVSRVTLSDSSEDLNKLSPALLNQAVRSVAAWADGRLVLGMSRDFILASDDGGQTWSRGAFSALTVRGRGGDGPTHPMAQGDDVRAVRDRPGVAYAHLNAPGSYSLRGLARTDDGGRSWSLVIYGLYITTFDVDPSDPSMLYTGQALTIQRSEDGGASFADLADQPPLTGPDADGKASISSLAAGRGDWALAIGTSDGQLLRRRDGATGWEEVSRSPNGEGIARLSASDRPDAPLIAVTHDGTVWRVGSP